MSKIIFTLLVLALFFPLPIKASAESGYKLNEEEIYLLLDNGHDLYARIPETGTIIYSDTLTSDALFALPKSYYLLVLSYTSESCKVCYCFEDYDYARAVIGYVKTNDLYFVDTPPTNKSFPNVFVEFEGNGTFYKNNRFDSYYSASDGLPSDDTFFYGFLTSNNQVYCYVLKNGKFGYFSADVFAPITIPDHSDRMPKDKVILPPDEPPPTSLEDTSLLSTDTGKVVFIAVTCVIAITLAYLVFLPKRKPKERLDEYDEEAFDE